MRSDQDDRCYELLHKDGSSKVPSHTDGSEYTWLSSRRNFYVIEHSIRFRCCRLKNCKFLLTLVFDRYVTCRAYAKEPRRAGQGDVPILLINFYSRIGNGFFFLEKIPPIDMVK